MTKTPVTAQRKLHMDVLRILAVFFVMYTHTNEKGMYYYSYEGNSLYRWLWLGLSLCSRIAVPLFFMISGALLLGKQETKARVWKKRILRMSLILLAISVIYGVYHILLHDWVLKPYDWFNMIYRHGMFVHLWYLYSYIAFLMMLPLLRKMVQNMDNGDFLYFIAIAFVLSYLVPLVDWLVYKGQGGLHSDLRGVMFTTVNLLWPVIGYWLENVQPEKFRNWKTAAGGVVLSGLSILAGAYLTMVKAGYHGAPADQLHNYATSFHMVPVMTVYFCAKLFFDAIRIPPWLSRLLTGMGGTVFGVYLLDQILREQTAFVYDIALRYVPSPVACVAWIACAMALGMGLVFILKKIPVIRLMF